jgi:hypothetical protein
MTSYRVMTSYLEKISFRFHPRQDARVVQNHLSLVRQTFANRVFPFAKHKSNHRHCVLSRFLRFPFAKKTVARGRIVILPRDFSRLLTVAFFAMTRGNVCWPLASKICRFSGIHRRFFHEREIELPRMDRMTDLLVNHDNAQCEYDKSRNDKCGAKLSRTFCNVHFKSNINTLLHYTRPFCNVHVHVYVSLMKELSR